MHRKTSKFVNSHHRKLYLPPSMVVLAMLCVTTLCVTSLLFPFSTFAQSGSSADPNACYAIADNDNDNPDLPNDLLSPNDVLVKINRETGEATVIGETNTVNIEAMAFKPGGATLYATDGGLLGTINLTTGAFTAIGTGIGNNARGLMGSTPVTENIRDVDSLTYDMQENVLYGAHRFKDNSNGTRPDILVKIDPVTGTFIPDAFGTGVDFVEVLGSKFTDVDDLAVDPITGTLYGISNRNGQGDELVTIDKATGTATVLDEFTIDDMEGLAFFNDGGLYASTGQDFTTLPGGGTLQTQNTLYRLDDKTLTEEPTLIGSLAITNTTGPLSGILNQDFEALGCLTADAFIGLEKATNGEDADIPTGPQVTIGDPITWTYVIVNTGVFDIENVTLTDDQEGIVNTCTFPNNGLTNGLQPGEQVTCILTSTAQSGQYANIAQVDATWTNPLGQTLPLSDTDPSHYIALGPGITLQKLTNGNDADGANDSDVPEIAPSGTVIWTYLVTNTGTLSMTVADITVTDNQPGVTPVRVPASDVGGDGFLEPGESWAYTATLPAENLVTSTSGVTIVPGCDPGNTGNVRPTYENIGTVTALGMVATDPSHYCNPPQPGLTLQKATNGNDADGANDADVPEIAPGDAVIWTYVVTNTGNISYPVANVSLTDDQPGVTPMRVLSSDAGSDNILSPGESWTYTATLPAENLSTSTSGATIIPGCDPGNTGNTRATYENIGTVTIGTLTATDPSHYCNPGQSEIQLQKLTNGNDADGANGADVPVIAPGDSVVWTYVITNTGNQSFPVANVNLTDDQPGVIPMRVLSSDTGADGILSPGESWTYTATLPAENLVTSTSGVTIVQGCDPGNTGNTRATYENIGTVVIGALTATDPSHYCNPPQPGLTLQKATNGNDADGANDADVPEIVPGDAVVWTYMATNTGNVSYPAANVSLTDDQPGVTPMRVLSSDAGGDGILSPGESWTYTATLPAENLATSTSGVTIVQGCDPGNTGNTRATYENIGTVTIGTLTASDPSHYCNPGQTEIVLQKLTNGNDADGANDADVPVITPGDSVVWTYVITNTGNQSFPVANVNVTDNQSGVTPMRVLSSDTGADGILSPGESWTYTATLPAENLVTSTSGVTIVQGCDPGNTGNTRATYENIGTVVIGVLTASDPSHYCNPPQPGLTLQKLTNGNDADGANDADVPVIAPGDSVVWTYVVTNTGNVSYPAANVSLTDDQPGVTPARVLSTDVGGDGILSPGESWTYTATLPAENLATSTSGATIVQGCDPDNSGDPRATYENIGTVSAGGQTATDPSHYCNPPILTPGIDVEKWTNGEDADVAPGPEIFATYPVTWTYIISNTGDTPLTNITLTDDKIGDITVNCPKTDLALNEEMICIATGTATAGQYENTAVVTGTTPIDPLIPTATVTDTDPSHYNGIALASVGDTVFFEGVTETPTGIQPISLTGVSDITVTLYMSGTATPIATTVTDANGKYLFENLIPGDYYLVFEFDPSLTEISEPYNWSPTDAGTDDALDSDANPALAPETNVAQTEVFNLEPGEVDTTQDAGVYQISGQGSGEVGDLVWYDENRNGIQDSGEPGISGVPVRLYDATTNALVGQTVTDANGKYAIGGLLPGDYYLIFDEPPGYAAFTQQGPSGGKDPNDSDGDKDTGRTENFTLADGESDPSWDIGLLRPGVGDRVWYDRDRRPDGEPPNGIQDSDELGVPNVSVELYDAATNALVGQDITDSDGYYFIPISTGSEFYLVFTIPENATTPGDNQSVAGFTEIRRGTDRTADSDANSLDPVNNPRVGQTANFTIGAEIDLTFDVGIIAPPTSSPPVEEPLMDNFIYLPTINR